MDRIQVNGVWYIKEPTSEPIKLKPVDYIGCVVEDDYFAFDATVSGSYQMISYLSIKVTDKREGKGQWKEENWDHMAWMNGVLEDNPESLETLTKDGWGSGDIKYLQAFLQHLKEKGWL